MPLAELEELAGANTEPTTELADAILAWVKDDQPAAKPPTKARWPRRLQCRTPSRTPSGRCARSPRDETCATGCGRSSASSAATCANRPVVVQPGGLVVVETPSRATAGAHYTPRSLAEEVVLHALEPLVY